MEILLHLFKTYYFTAYILASSIPSEKNDKKMFFPDG